MVEDRKRSELFGDVLLRLDLAAETAAETGSEEVASHIREMLVPFIQKEQIFAQMAEEA